MHNDAAIVHLCVGIGELARNDISALAIFVHKNWGVEIARTARMLVAEVKLAQYVCLGEKPTDSILKLASWRVTELSQILREFDSERVGCASLYHGSIQEALCVLDKQDSTLEAQVGHVEE